MSPPASDPVLTALALALGLYLLREPLMRALRMAAIPFLLAGMILAATVAHYRRRGPP